MPLRWDAVATYIFDFDNTLVDSRIDFAAVRSEIASAMVPPMDPADASGLAIGELIALAPEERQAALWEIVERHEVNGMAEADAVRGAPEVLAALRARGDAVALLTNNSRWSTEAALRRLGLADAFDAVVARGDGPRMKPDPEGIRWIRERLGPRAEQCLVVGDSWLDGLAAHRAGVPFVAYRPRPGALERHGIEPLRVISDLREMLILPIAAT